MKQIDDVLSAGFAQGCASLVAVDFIFAAFKERLKAAIRIKLGKQLCYLSAAESLKLKMNNLARVLCPFLTMP